MIRAVIFDMFETLITHYQSPLYFGAQMAQDAGIPEEDFQRLWRTTEYDRSIGKVTFEKVLEWILRENQCYSETLLRRITEKRVEAKRACFRYLYARFVKIVSFAINEKESRAERRYICYR